MNTQKAVMLSEICVKNGEHNIVININSQTNQINICGDNVFVNALTSRPQLFQQIEGALMYAMEKIQFGSSGQKCMEKGQKRTKTGKR